MIEKLKHILSETHRFYIFGIKKSDEVVHFDLIELHYKNKELKIENRFSSDALEDIIRQHCKKKLPVLLHFEGDNVINKTVENKTGYRNNLIFKADPEDFYFYELHQDPSVFLSIVRKSYIDEFIQKFIQLDLFVIHVSFGPFVMMNLAPVMKDYNGISSSIYNLTIADGQLISYDHQNDEHESYVINGEAFTFKDIPMVAAFFDYEFPSLSIVFEKEFLNTNKSEFRYSKLFKKLGVFTLVFILLALFIGHYVLNFYVDALAEKQQEYSFSQQTISTIENLKGEVGLKEKILLTSGLNNTKFLTNYAADIGNSVLDNITINSIDVNPILKKIKQGEKIGLDLNTIHIIGESTDDNSFNDWVNKMKNFKWLNKIDIVEYSKETNNVDAFKITIKL